MSEKELMYIDDTLSHLKQMDEIACYLKEYVSEEVVELIEKTIEKNKKIFDGIYKLIK